MHVTLESQSRFSKGFDHKHPQGNYKLIGSYLLNLLITLPERTENSKRNWNERSRRQVFLNEISPRTNQTQFLPNHCGCLYCLISLNRQNVMYGNLIPQAKCVEELEKNTLKQLNSYVVTTGRHFSEKEILPHEKKVIKLKDLN